MVEVRYLGRLGNNFFQYCLGRIIAERLGFSLVADPLPGFPATEEKIQGHDYSSYPVQELTGRMGQVIDLESIVSDQTKRKIVLNGYFQRYEYYQPYKEVIRAKWLVDSIPVPAESISKDDVAITIRLLDYFYNYNSMLPFSYYEDALAQSGYKRVFICTDEPTHPFIRRFDKYRPVIISKGPLDQFKFIASCNKIVVSQSSFFWWAAFLSKAQEVYLPGDCVHGFWSHDSHAQPFVWDEKRYRQVPCRGAYRMNSAELFCYWRNLKTRILKKAVSFIPGASPRL